MSSREISDLAGKRHDHVLRDIEKMLSSQPWKSLTPNLGVAIKIAPGVFCRALTYPKT